LQLLLMVPQHLRQHQLQHLLSKLLRQHLLLLRQ
jgi:hypothetical protein